MKGLNGPENYFRYFGFDLTDHRTAEHLRRISYEDPSYQKSME